MQVFELAKDLSVSTRLLLTLLRKMGVALRGDRDFVPVGDVSRLLARIERERRQHGSGTSEAVQSVLEDVRSTRIRRRRSRVRRVRRVERSEPETRQGEQATGTRRRVARRTTAPAENRSPERDTSATRATSSKPPEKRASVRQVTPSSAPTAAGDNSGGGSVATEAPRTTRRAARETSGLSDTARVAAPVARHAPDSTSEPPARRPSAEARQEAPASRATRPSASTAAATEEPEGPKGSAPDLSVPSRRRRASAKRGVGDSTPVPNVGATPKLRSAPDDRRDRSTSSAPKADAKRGDTTPVTRETVPQPTGSRSATTGAVKPDKAPKKKKGGRSDDVPRASTSASTRKAAGGETPSASVPPSGARGKPKLRSARSQSPSGPVRAVRSPKPSPTVSARPGGQVSIQGSGYGSDGGRKGRKKGRKRHRVDQNAVQQNLQRVMAELKSGGRRRRKSRQQRPTVEEQATARQQAHEEKKREATTVRVNEFLTVAELGELIDVSSTELIGSALKSLGLMVTINQRLDFDQIEMLLDEFGFIAVREEEYGAHEQEDDTEQEDPADLLPRPPVVTVMGHVDHGKTRLLDSIRNTNVIAGEAGGITQHIGAYHVDVDDERSLTFLDTPGHAAFTAMRARGTDVTDIVILVVAADDSVMPQTIEAISHARNAGVPMVVAINKMDLPTANPERVKQELLGYEVTVEDYGGDVLAAPISARSGTGIDDLLEKVLLQAELLELQANPNRAASGAVIEARLDIGKGPVVSVLVQKGTLRVGDDFICGKFDGRVRALLDERGMVVKEAGPGIPVQILGVSGVPQAGDTLRVMDATRASEIASTRQRLEREKLLRIKDRGIKLGDFSQILSAGEVSTLPLIIKGDVDGSVQAVSDTLERLGTQEARVEIIHRAVGAINEEDVLLARTAGGVIIGFRVRPNVNARQLAEREGVDIQVYDVIYDAENDVRAALEGMLSPDRREKIVGTAKVRETFKVSKVGTIAGCYVSEGAIEHQATLRLIRNGIVAYTGEVGSLRRFKDDVGRVRAGLECGIGIANYNDVKVGDVIECFVVEEVARTLPANPPGR